MRAAIVLLLLAGCSTVQSRRDDPPVFVTETAKSLADFQGCFAERTAKQNVQYMPRVNGGSFSSGAGPQRYVFWVVDIDDLGSSRRVSVHAVNGPTARNLATPAVRACV